MRLGFTIAAYDDTAKKALIAASTKRIERNSSLVMLLDDQRRLKTNENLRML